MEADAAAGAVWDRFLQAQTDLLLPFELPFYREEQAWHDTPEVLDLGTGNGCYLSALRARFPDKRYRGIDRDRDAIARAQARYAADGLAFEFADLLDTQGSCPFVIGRLVAQTVDPIEAFLEAVSRLLPPGGTFFSVEPNDSKRLFSPAWPAFEDVLSEFAAQQSRWAVDRAVAVTMQRLAPRFGLQLASFHDVIVPSSGGGAGGLFWGFQGVVLELFESVFRVPADYDRLREELADRSNDPRAYGQAALYLSVYRKVA